MQLLDKYGVPMKAVDVPVSSGGTAIVGGKLDEIVVANAQDKELLEYLNTVYKFSDEPELKITLQEN